MRVITNETELNIRKDSHTNMQKTSILLISGYSMIKGLPYNSGNELETIINIIHKYTHKVKSDSFEVI